MNNKIHIKHIVLIIDDCPSRYDEFCRLLDKDKIKWVITQDRGVIDLILPEVGVIMLDHDMPISGQDTVIHYNSKLRDIFVIVTSTSIEENIMALERLLKRNEIVHVINSADHVHCEIEWLDAIHTYYAVTSQLSINKKLGATRKIVTT